VPERLAQQAPAQVCVLCPSSALVLNGNLCPDAKAPAKKDDSAASKVDAKPAADTADAKADAKADTKASESKGDSKAGAIPAASAADGKRASMRKADVVSKYVCVCRLCGGS
jgi:hypothetical protein